MSCLKGSEYGMVWGQGQESLAIKRDNRFPERRIPTSEHNVWHGGIFQQNFLQQWKCSNCAGGHSPCVAIEHLKCGCCKRGERGLKILFLKIKFKQPHVASSYHIKLCAMCCAIAKLMTKESNESRYSLGQRINSLYPASQSCFVPGRRWPVGKTERITLLGIQTLKDT